GSRGGLVGCFFGLLVVTALAPLERRARVGLGAGVVGALVLSAWAMTIPSALPASAATAAAPASASRTLESRNAEQVLPLEQEIGNPWWTHRSGGFRGSPLHPSRRRRAPPGAVDPGPAGPPPGARVRARRGGFRQP